MGNGDGENLERTQKSRKVAHVETKESFYDRFFIQFPANCRELGEKRHINYVGLAVHTPIGAFAAR